MSRLLLLRRRRSVNKPVDKKPEKSSECKKDCCKKHEQPKKQVEPKKPVQQQEEDDDIFEIQGITLRDPETNKTFKLKANAAVRDAFGCKCIEEEDEAYTANIPTHVLDMALRHSH